MKPLFLVSVGLVLQQPLFVLAQTSPATIVSIGDGDTVRVQLNQKVTTIRLACADAPEIAQRPYGTISAQRLKQLLPVGNPIVLRVVEKDKYGRTVAEVFVNKKSINLQMVEEGQAAVYRQYLKNCSSTQQQYLAAEASAKRRQLGFWNQPNPVMPWDFRRGNAANRSRSAPTTRFQRANCDPSYPDLCLAPSAAELNCSDIPYRNFRVVGSDPHRFDRDGDGIGCEGR